MKFRTFCGKVRPTQRVVRMDRYRKRREQKIVIAEIMDNLHQFLRKADSHFQKAEQLRREKDE